jgi:hypothetical protein
MSMNFVLFVKKMNNRYCEEEPVKRGRWRGEERAKGGGVEGRLDQVV